MAIPFRAGLLIALAAIFAASPTLAEEDPHAACTTMGWVPPEVLQRRVALREGTGNTTDVATTSSNEALLFYRQGLNYLHGYVWIEAARSFNQALRVDPDFALAYWGLSRVYSGLDDHEEAVRAAQRAQSLASKVSPREQRRIALRLQQLEAIADLGNANLHAAYKQALDKALATDFDDVELWLIRGNAEEPTAAGRGQRGGVPSTAFYGAALRLEPQNAAAHHYLIHSHETIGQINRALEHGETYAGLAPAVPHALRAEMMLRTGKLDEGSTLLKDVQGRLRALPGPDAWTQALFRLEAFARIARDVSAWDLAEHTARQYWKDADRGLRELKELP